MIVSSSTPTRTTYAECLSRNLIVSDASARQVPDRDPARIAREAGPGVYAFRFYDIITTTAGGTSCRSNPVDVSPWYFIDARRLTAEDVEALPGDHSVLLANMRGNGWAFVAGCRTGGYQPMGPQDKIIDSETGRLS
jgi:hypothetical protein